MGKLGRRPALSPASTLTLAEGSANASECIAHSRQNLEDSPEALQEKPRGAASIVLLAEDNPMDAFLVMEAVKLYELPVVVHVLEDGEKAFAFIETVESDDVAPCPAIALLDLNLPKRDGIEILQRIRQSPKCGRIPVIIVTSSDSPKDQAETARLGANRYFRKPADYDEFLKLGAVLKEVIEKFT